MTIQDVAAINAANKAAVATSRVREPRGLVYEELLGSVMSPPA
jgi:hypothetical protein